VSDSPTLHSRWLLFLKVLNLIDWFTSNQMKVNPDKFQAIAIGKNTQSKNISLNLNGNIILEAQPTEPVSLT
jgi:hypothetical protein